MSTAFLSLAPVGARAAPVEPLPSPAGAPPAVGSLTYVKDLDHLATLVSSDNALHTKTLEITRKAYLGTGVLMGSAVLGALIVVGAATVFTRTECISPSVPAGFDLPVSPICQSSTNEPMAVAGMMTMVVGGIAGLMLMPHQGDLLDVVNDWNARHPERTLLLLDGDGHHHH